MKKFPKIALILVLAVTLLLNLSLIACCGDPTKEDIEIVFKVDGQDDVSVTFTEGGEVSFPDNPQVDGKHFLGWFLDDGTAVDASYFKNSETNKYHGLTIYAKFYSLGNFEYNGDNLGIKAGTEDVPGGKVVLGGVTLKGSDNELTTITVKSIEGERSTNNKVSVTLLATGKHDLTKEITINNVKVYGYPSISVLESKKAIKVTDTITPTLFGANAKDSFGVEIPKKNVEISSSIGNPKAGDTITVQITATDSFGNKRIREIPNVKVYGTPSMTYNTAKKNVTETEEITYETFALAAKDSFNQPLIVKTEVISGNKEVDTDLVVKATSVADPAGNVATQEFTVTVKADTTDYIEDGTTKYVSFGKYPQSVKEDDISILNPNNPNSEGYYIGKEDGMLYAKRFASHAGTNPEFLNGKAISGGVEYYFRVEPILWRVLATDSGAGKDLLLCEYILDGMQYDTTSNKYTSSAIKDWINNSLGEGFYSLAFNAAQRLKIPDTLVDNSATSTGFPGNPNSGAGTTDKIFLISYEEIGKTAYGFDGSYNSSNDRFKQKFVSDYARAAGVVYNSTQNGMWWLRSPSNEVEGKMVRVVNAEGVVETQFSQCAIVRGVVPALWLKGSGE